MNANQIINKIEFFDFLKAFFVDDAVYKKLTRKAKLQHAFMLYRTLAIRYPIAAHAINYLHDVRVIDALHKQMLQPPPPPQWLYQKTDKIKQTEKKQGLLTTYNRAALDGLMNIHNLEWRSVLRLAEEAPDELKNELNNIQDCIEMKITKNKNYGTKP